LVLARALVATASAVLRHASQSQAAHPLMQPWTDTSRKGDLSGRDGILAPQTPRSRSGSQAGGSAPCDASDAWTHADVSGDGYVTSQSYRR